MKSIWTSTFSFSAHSLTSACVALLAPGTQWSQKPIDSLPAAPAVRTNGAAIMVAEAAAVLATKRRREILLFFIFKCPPMSRPRRPVAGRLRPLSVRLTAHEALELAHGPGQRLLHRLALHVAHDPLRHQALRVDLHRNLVRGRRRRDRQDLVIVRVGIVIERALGRPDLGPGLEG